MGYNYEELMDKYRRNYNDLTAEEIDFLCKESRTRLIAGMPISVNGFYLAIENDYGSYNYGDATDFYSHGWVGRELIVNIDGKNYLAYVSWHDDYGIDEDDSLQFVEVEKKQVLVERWVEVENENRN